MPINTIGGLIEHNIRLTAWCNACRHHDLLDLDALGRQLGFDHSTMHDDLTPKLKCSACGSKQIGLIMSPESAPDK